MNHILVVLQQKTAAGNPQNVLATNPRARVPKNPASHIVHQLVCPPFSQLLLRDLASGTLHPSGVGVVLVCLLAGNLQRAPCLLLPPVHTENILPLAGKRPCMLTVTSATDVPLEDTTSLILWNFRAAI
eukprot:TRINITY_DN27816_c0_g1_i1.p2 TRINITY_DN27816_c0_g1~~TRINITY_DN27816_c0_g1_i1.p2  ORF type:complete len:129 (-),score=3.10 TRINITY_DN27816_c0_g1_i1:1811-2197(-)